MLTDGAGVALCLGVVVVQAVGLHECRARCTTVAQNDRSMIFAGWSSTMTEWSRRLSSSQLSREYSYGHSQYFQGNCPVRVGQAIRLTDHSG